MAQSLMPRGSRLMSDSRAGSAGSLATLIAGLGLDLTLAILLGAGRETDALFVALRIPIGISVFFPPTAIQVLVPAMTQWTEVGDTDTANANTSRVLLATFVVSSVLALVGVALSTVLVHLLAPGLDPASLALAADLSRIAFLMIPAAAMSQVFRAYRHAQRRHGFASALQSILGLTIVAVLISFPGSVDVGLVVWAYLIGTLLQLLAAWTLARAQGFRFEWSLRPNAEIRSLGSRSLRPLAASGVQLGIRIAEQMVASFLAPGSITILTYANRLISAIGGTLFFRPVVTAFLVPMSKRHTLGDEAGVRILLKEGLRLLVFISLGLSAFVAIAGPSVVSGVFGLGDLTREQAGLLGLTVAVYSASLPTAALQRMLLSVSFARLETSPYLRNTIYGAMANVGLLFLLVPLWGLPNKILVVPIAYSLAQIVNAVHAHRVASRQLGSPQIHKGLLAPTLAIGVAAIAMFATLLALSGLRAKTATELIGIGLVTTLVGTLALVISGQLVLPGGLRSLIPNEPGAPIQSRRDVG